MAAPGWIGVIEKALSGIMDVMSAVTFIQFIEEEALQSAGLGAFLALRHGSYSGAGLAINRMYEILDNLYAINTYLGWMAPYSKRCFEDFAKATETNIQIYTDLMWLKVRSKQ